MKPGIDRREFLRAGGAGLTGMALLSAYSTVTGKRVNAQERRPNVLWFMLDDGRADALGCYGSTWARTPNLDRLAAEGVLFSSAFVQNPVCIPSRRSMKTGFYSHQAGPVAMGRPPEKAGAYIDRDLMDRLGRSPNLLDAWTSAGTKPVNVGKVHGFRRSWDHRGDEPRLISVSGRPTAYFRKKYGQGKAILKSKMVFTKTHNWQIGGILPIRPEDTVTWRIGDKALGVLEELAGKKEPFFLRVSFHAPHVACYVPREYFVDPAKIDLPLPTEEELKSKPRFEQGPLHVYGHADHLGREGIDLARGTYYGMVSLVDVQVGRIVDALKASGRLDDTIIAFNSDQGFQLGEHGLWKKRVFYDQNVKVPFFLRYPAVLPRGKVIDELVEMVDFLPTLMELSHLLVPDGIRGRSLVPLARGEVRKWREAVFSEIDHSQSMYKELRRNTGRRVMVRTGEWKLVFFMDDRVKDKDGALYDLKRDPREQRNLYGDPEYADRVRELEALAERWGRGENLMA